MQPCGDPGRACCRYIVGFYGCGWSKETEEQEVEGKELPQGQRLFFLQELMEGGTLQHVVMRAMASAVRPCCGRFASLDT